MGLYITINYYTRLQGTIGEPGIREFYNCDKFIVSQLTIKLAIGAKKPHIIGAVEKRQTQFVSKPVTRKCLSPLVGCISFLSHHYGLR